MFGGVNRTAIACFPQNIVGFKNSGLGAYQLRTDKPDVTLDFPIGRISSQRFWIPAADARICNPVMRDRVI
jgi:hypothetical protein